MLGAGGSFWGDMVRLLVITPPPPPPPHPPQKVSLRLRGYGEHAGGKHGYSQPPLPPPLPPRKPQKTQGAPERVLPRTSSRVETASASHDELDPRL